MADNETINVAGIDVPMSVYEAVRDGLEREYESRQSDHSIVNDRLNTLRMTAYTLSSMLAQEIGTASRIDDDVRPDANAAISAVCRTITKMCEVLERTFS